MSLVPCACAQNHGWDPFPQCAHNPFPTENHTGYRACHSLSPDARGKYIIHSICMSYLLTRTQIQQLKYKKKKGFFCLKCELFNPFLLDCLVAKILKHTSYSSKFVGGALNGQNNCSLYLYTKFIYSCLWHLCTFQNTFKSISSFYYNSCPVCLARPALLFHEEYIKYSTENPKACLTSPCLV